jgi:Ion channel
LSVLQIVVAPPDRATPDEDSIPVFLCFNFLTQREQPRKENHVRLAITLGAVVAQAVFRRGRVTYHRIIGAILVYLLIAVAFGALFVLIGLSVPDAFKGITFEDNPALANSVSYLSFVTLTSTGFGDIVPVHPIARSLCNIESIIGQLYPATLLARLVTLEMRERSSV